MIPTGIIASRAAAAGGGLPLDSHTTNLVGAYSTRRLLTSHSGSLIRVRRSNDNAEQDIGYDGSDNLNATALATFVGSNSAFIVTWYDQSGGARDATQSTAAKQLRIVLSGTLQTSAGRACAIVVATNDGPYPAGTFSAYTGSTLSGVCVWRAENNAGDYRRMLAFVTDALEDYSAATRCGMFAIRTGNVMQGYRNGDLANLTADLDTVYAAAGRFDGANWNIRQGSNTNSSASSGAFAVNRVVLCGESASSAVTGVDNFHMEWAAWTRDIGDTAAQAILAEQRTYWTAS